MAHRLQQRRHVITEGDAACKNLVGRICAQVLCFLAAAHKGVGLLLLADLAEELCLHDRDDVINDVIQRPRLSILLIMYSPHLRTLSYCYPKGFCFLGTNMHARLASTLNLRTASSGSHETSGILVSAATPSREEAGHTASVRSLTGTLVWICTRMTACSTACAV